MEGVENGHVDEEFSRINCYYRRFIKYLSTITSPLTGLTNKDKKFKWDARCENSFMILKKHLTTARVLTIPKGIIEGFMIYTNASNLRYGVVLMRIKRPSHIFHDR